MRSPALQRLRDRLRLAGVAASLGGCAAGPDPLAPPAPPASTVATKGPAPRARDPGFAWIRDGGAPPAPPP